MRVVLADDQTLVRHGLRALLEEKARLTVIADVSNGREAVAHAVEGGADLVILDLRLPELNGIEVTRRVRAELPSAQVVVVASQLDRRAVRQALEAGAAAVLSKGQAFSALLEVIEQIRGGKLVVSSTGSKRDPAATDTADSGEGYELLSSREREVLQLLAEGRASKEVAADLGLSTKTVDAHRRRIMGKLNVHSVPELTRVAIREGLVDGFSPGANGGG